MMTIIAARQINDNDIVFCGTGISMLAAMAAKKINAPRSVIFFETGAIDSKLEELPMSVADPRIMYFTSANSGILDSFSTMQNQITGQYVVGILGAAQIDKFGNLNSTIIGDFDNPKIRLAGSGGGCDVASFVSRSIIFMQHERRKFVLKLDYLTSPGYLGGAGQREQAGLCKGGPESVITNLGVMKFDDDTKEMYLHSFYPGISIDQILDNTSFSMDVSKATEEVPPTKEELYLLREKCDKQRLILG